MSLYERGAEFVRKHPTAIRVGAAVVLAMNALVATAEVRASTSPKAVTTTTQQTQPGLDILRAFDSGNKIPIQKNSNGNGNGNDNTDSDDPNNEESNLGNAYRERKRKEKEDTRNERRAKKELEGQIREQERDPEDRKIDQCIEDLKRNSRGETVPGEIRVVAQKGTTRAELERVIRARGGNPYVNPLDRSIHTEVLQAEVARGNERRASCELIVRYAKKVKHAEPNTSADPLQRAIEECIGRKKGLYANSQYSENDSKLNVILKSGILENAALDTLRELGYDPEEPYSYPATRRLTIGNIHTANLLRRACVIELDGRVRTAEPDFRVEVSQIDLVESAFSFFRKRQVAVKPSFQDLSKAWRDRIAA